MSIDAALPAQHAPAVAARVQRAASDRVVERIWERDDTLWGPAGAPEVSNRLGWLDIADRLLEDVADLEAFAAQARGDGLTDCVLLGMGGSSLAPEVFRRSYADAPGLTLHVLDSTDAQAVRDVEAAIDLEHTLFIVSSKSGGTIETMSALALFWERTGGEGSQFVAVTDPDTSLAQLGADRGFRRVFVNDPNIGGRYSALSYFGIVPAVLLGADVRAILESARQAAADARDTDAAQNTALWLGCALGELALQGRDKLTFIVDEPLAAFGLWVEQLVAESLGKHGKGILPVADEPLGEAGSYGPDRVLVHLAGGDNGHVSAINALRDAGVPMLSAPFAGPADLGRIMFAAEFATAVAGWVLEINPFDQPNVQAAKDKTKEVLAMAQPPEIPEATDDVLRALLSSGPPSYLAIQGYLAPGAAVDEAVSELRALIRDRTRMTTTFGYGPRYLHSTGQLHKGGPPTGRFLQLVTEVDPDLDIPAGDPPTFETLKRAQADGDLLILREHDLPAERVILRGDPAQAIAALKETLA